MDFPTIHTNFWDAVIAVPIVMISTQVVKVFFKIPKKYIPSIALLIGFFVSIFISHRHSLPSGLFMGYFYGYAAIGTYASLKTALLSFRREKEYR